MKQRVVHLIAVYARKIADTELLIESAMREIEKYTQLGDREGLSYAEGELKGYTLQRKAYVEAKNDFDGLLDLKL